MGFIVIFAYDHTGERTLKMTGDAMSVDQNAFNHHIYSSLNNVTLYPSPYLVLTNSGYTKHYYAGADRVCARIGSGGLNQDTTGIRGTSEISQCVDSLFLHCIEQMNNYVPSADTGNIVTIDGEALLDTTSTNTNKTPTGLHVDVVPNITRFNAVFEESLSENHSPRAPYYEPDVYFYHSDHLGSASWITDGEGNAVQHLQYLPFGQPYINQHPAGYQERYTFTGKELDRETEYGYFGARYMDHGVLTMWLSVDPMTDHYLGFSPYQYCRWNPVKRIDVDGLFDIEKKAQKAHKKAVKRFGIERVGEIFNRGTEEKPDYSFHVYGVGKDNKTHGQRDGVWAYRPDKTISNKRSLWFYSLKQRTIGISASFSIGAQVSAGITLGKHVGFNANLSSVDLFSHTTEYSRIKKWEHNTYLIDDYNIHGNRGMGLVSMELILDTIALMMLLVNV